MLALSTLSPNETCSVKPPQAQVLSEPCLGTRSMTCRRCQCPQPLMLYGRTTLRPVSFWTLQACKALEASCLHSFGYVLTHGSSKTEDLCNCKGPAPVLPGGSCIRARRPLRCFDPNLQAPWGYDIGYDMGRWSLHAFPEACLPCRKGLVDRVSWACHASRMVNALAPRSLPMRFRRHGAAVVDVSTRTLPV